MQLMIKVDQVFNGERLDVFLSRLEDQYPQLRGISRTRIQQLIRQGCVRSPAGQFSKPNHRLSGGEQILLDIPDPEPLEVEPENLPLKILYEDAHLAVIDKPAGMVVHPGAKNRQGTLVGALLYHLKGLSGIGGVMRPGIVHRLDKGTSGLIIVAKHDEAHIQLSNAFKQRKIKKVYLALALGCPRELQGVMDYPIARHRTQRHKMAAIVKRRDEDTSNPANRRIKRAITRYEVLTRWQTVSSLSLHLETGRTHQIRVHLSQLGHPIIGDSTYGYRWQKNQLFPHSLVEELDGLALHAWKLEFLHPITQEPMRLEAAVPERIQKLIDYLHQMP